MQRDSECAPSCVEFIYLNTVHDAFVSRVIEEYQMETYQKSNRKCCKF